ncbi:SDR family oxidoreductase [Candidatus Saccharibacteria bacterium]|nr:SDR family oxidoreductase [Candidatus Saccharibacteria bacterium]
MKKIYVIGSSSNISEALARLVNGYSCVFIGRSNPHNLKQFINFKGMDDELSVDFLLTAITDDMQATKNLESASLVIVAGISSHDWRESYLVNEYLPAKLSEEFSRYVAHLPLLNSSITLVGSAAAHLGAKMPYATTKAALGGILHTIARDFRGKVRINLILPSAFESAMIADWGEDKKEAVASSNYIGRLGTSDDMADAILFAVQNEFITNSTINMTGGTVHT